MIKLLKNNIECEICNILCKSLAGLSYHLNIKHSINSVNYTIRYLLNNKIPCCKCGCNEQVEVYNYRLNEYKRGHTGGGCWQNNYDKNSIEYKQIVEKLSKSVSRSTLGVKKSKEHANNISIGMIKRIGENREEFLLAIEKMKSTKLKQSTDGTLSKKHFTNNKIKEEIDRIYNDIVDKSNKTKELKKKLGIYPDVWNKGKTKLTDIRINKYSGKNHYRWNKNKDREYTNLFYDTIYRKLLLVEQNNICFLCDVGETLCLHHINENKLDDNPENLVFLCRSCHMTVHNNIKNYRFNLKNIRRRTIGFLNNVTTTVDAIN